ncbi:MAG: ankyrin repeat domain-containing protein, partial [Hyphomonadaceae bacterium]|nr:ankyrin repeat domain-containing protein [Hyphomonadaceae bacterium]
ETIAALIESGADMQARTRDGFTPLHLAARYGTAETVATLVKAGTDTKITQVIPFFRPVAAFFGAGAKVNGRDKYGRTPLHEAARYGTAEAVTALVKAGAKVNAREEKYGQTPLHRAAWKGTAGTVAALIEAGADIRAKGNDGNLPADLAGDNCKDPDIFRVLNAARYR